MDDKISQFNFYFYEELESPPPTFPKTIGSTNLYLSPLSNEMQISLYLTFWFSLDYGQT